MTVQTIFIGVMLQVNDTHTYSSMALNLKFVFQNGAFLDLLSRNTRLRSGLRFHQFICNCILHIPHIFLSLR